MRLDACRDVKEQDQQHFKAMRCVISTRQLDIVVQSVMLYLNPSLKRVKQKSIYRYIYELKILKHRAIPDIVVCLRCASDEQTKTIEHGIKDDLIINITELGSLLVEKLCIFLRRSVLMTAIFRQSSPITQRGSHKMCLSGEIKNKQRQSSVTWHCFSLYQSLQIHLT